jgi:signal peptidase II
MLPTKQTLILLGAVMTLMVDRFFKYAATQGYFEIPRPLVGEMLSLNAVKNTNIAFSIPLSGVFLNITITILLLFLIAYMIWALKHNKSELNGWLFIMLLGAVSNLFDRYNVGGVIDYLDLKYFTVFNLADVMIIVGILGVFWLFHKERAIESRV